MKNILKIIIVLMISSITFYFLKFAVPMNFLQASSKKALVVQEASYFIIFVVVLTLFWVLFFRDKRMSGSFLDQVRLKRVCAAIMVLFALSFLFLPSKLKLWELIHESHHFINETTYENSYFHFQLTYPQGSVFASANPQLGFVTRFFFPNRQKIAGDEENIGIYVDENSKDLETIIKLRQDAYSKNGVIDVNKVQFGGQEGYRIVFVSDYTVQKGTKELSYLTVKDGTLFELNYFPVVDENLSIVDSVANSFRFTQ